MRKEVTDKKPEVQPADEAIAILYSSGLSANDVDKISSHYGKRLGDILKTDPYDMVENVWKLSFFTADKVGQYLNISPEDSRRLRGAVLTAIKLYAEEGDMFALQEEVEGKASAIAGVSPEKIRPEIEELIEKGRIVRSLDGLYLPVYYKAEKEAADKLLSLIKNQDTQPLELTLPEKDIYGNFLSESQKEAINTVCNNNVSVITGGPGTGKTTTIKGLISIFLGLGKKVVLAAPTGRAAKRISELTGEEATTIHRLLGYTMGKGYRNKKLEADILILDEASMLEQVLFNHLLQAVGDKTKIVLVGDPDQLPAIGAGNVLRDMIDSGIVPVAKLDENFRQKDGSLIAANALSINKGDTISRNPANDFIYIDSGSVEDTHDRILSLLSKELPAYTGIASEEFLLVTPQQEGPLGAKQLNKELQERLNPDSPELKKGVKKFRLGDRVMQTENSSIRGIYNGEIGKVTHVDTEGQNLEVTFNDGKKSIYDIKELKELTLAYATTVHKLQGSEVDYILLVVSTAHRPMLYRNLFYTGVSRARKLCVMVGEDKALANAVATATRHIRNSNLKNRLRETK